MKTEVISALLLGSCLLCTQGMSNESEPIDAVAVWTTHCKKCHAEDGSGSTKIGKKFGARDYRDPVVQASFSDETIVKVTKEGVFDERGKKKMPPYADKLSVAEIEALIPLIRSFVAE